MNESDDVRLRKLWHKFSFKKKLILVFKVTVYSKKKKHNLFNLISCSNLQEYDFISSLYFGLLNLALRSTS